MFGGSMEGALSGLRGGVWWWHGGCCLVVVLLQLLQGKYQWGRHFQPVSTLVVFKKPPVV